LRQSYLRVSANAKKAAARLFHLGKRKQAERWVRKLRTQLGRLERDIRRKMEAGTMAMAQNPALMVALNATLELAERVRTQQPQDKNKIYALHAPEVECIGKGKARAKYEFGVKTSIAVT